MRSPEPRSRRHRPAKPPLSRDLITSTALGLISAHGLEALTMRALAQELDTGAAALYVYVRNRQALIDAMIDTALADVAIPGDLDAPWQHKLEAAAMGMVEALTRYPGLASGLVGRVPSAPSVLRISEAYLGILVQAGLDDLTCALAIDSLNSTVAAQATELDAFRAINGAARLDEAEGMLASLDPEAFPHLRGLSRTAMATGPLERARWTIRALIAGIASSPGIDGTPRPRKKEE